MRKKGVLLAALALSVGSASVMAIPQASADDLLSASSGLKTEDMTQDAQWHVNMSNVLVSDGRYVDYTFPTMDRSLLTNSQKQSVSMRLVANASYFMYTSQAHTVTVANSKGVVIQQFTTSTGNESGRFHFIAPDDDVYTITYSDFDKSLTALSFGKVTTQLKLYQLVQPDTKVIVDFDASKPNGNHNAKQYGFYVDTGHASLFDIHVDGLSSSNTRYDLTDDMYYGSNNDDVNPSYLMGRNNATIQNGQGDQNYDRHTEVPDYLQSNLLNKDFIALTLKASDADASGKIAVTTHAYDYIGGDKNQDTVKQLSLWDRFKSFIGDPVDTYSGGFLDHRTLMTYGGSDPLHFDLDYNSVIGSRKALSEGFTHNFESFLSKQKNTLTVNWTANVTSKFTYDESLKRYVANDPKQNATQVTVNADQLITIVDPDTGTWEFDQTGRLMRRTEKTLQVTNYSYDKAGHLQTVSNNRSQSYRFDYNKYDQVSTVTDGTGRQMTFDYDYNKRLKSIVLPNKHTMTFENAYGRITKLSLDGQALITNWYDNLGRVLKQQTIDGQYVTYNYDQQGSDKTLTTTYTQNNAVTKIVHDAAGNLLSKKGPNGQETTSQYNDKNQLVSSTRVGGETSSYDYDDQNHVVAQKTGDTQTLRYNYVANELHQLTTADNVSNQLSYDDKHRLTSVIDKSGLETKISYDNFSNPVSIVKQKDGVTYLSAENTYDANGYLVSTVVNGQKTVFENDALGRMIKQISPNNVVLTQTYDDDNHVLTSTVNNETTTYTYDGLGQPLTKTLPNGHKYHYSYQNNHLVSLSSHTDGSQPTSYSYNASGLLEQVKIGQDVVAKYGYDASDRKTSETDQNGAVTTYRYNNLDQVTDIVAGDTTKHLTYTLDGKIASVSMGNSPATNYVYDAVGHLVKTTYPDGSFVENTYDSMGHMLSETRDGKTLHYEYDAVGNRVKMIDANNQVTTYAYNLNGQIVTSVNALGHKTSYEYNAMGQLVKTLNNRGETTAQYAYDDMGNLTTVSNATGVVRRMSYGVNHQLLAVRDANDNLVSHQELNADEQTINMVNALNDKSEVSYNYRNSQVTTSVANSLNQKHAVTTNAKGQVTQTNDDVTTGTVSYDRFDNVALQYVADGKNKTSYTYDDNQNVIKETNNVRSMSYSYDLLNQLTSWTNARGQKTTYARDAFGQVVSAKADDIDEKYAYDKNGNEISAENKHGVINKTYDALNRVVTKTQNGQMIKYQYDDREFLSDVTYPGDKTVHYDVNTNGQVEAMIDWQNHKTSYQYDKNGRVIKTTNWNGIVEERTYNTAGQVLTIKTSLHDKTLTDYHYTYDSQGNLISDGSQLAYQYDAINRLTSGQSQYTYDAIGNITAVGTHKMTYDDDSRLTSVDGDKATVDNDGNLTNYTMSGKSHTASYNSQNQLTKYDGLEYTYDADGNRVSAGDTKFIYDDNGHLLSDGTNTYVYGASGVVGYYDKDNKFVTYLFNQRGDVVKETDESGSVTNSFDYNDYGKLIGSDHVTGSVFGYGGQYGAVTDKNGLVFLRTRYYNPEIMRFMNRDTVRGSVVDTKSLNRFAYVEGNPLTYVDPNGQAATWLKNNPLDGLYYGLMGLSFVPGLNIVTSVGMMAIDLAKGDYTSLAMDSLGIVIPGAAVGLKLSYDGVKAIVDGLRVGEKFGGFGIRVGAWVAEVANSARAIKSAVQVAGAKGALKVIETADRMAPHIGSDLVLAGIGHIAPESGPVAQKLQTFVKKFEEGSSGMDVVIPSSKSDFAKFFDETDSATFSKIFNDKIIHSKITDRLRNWPRGQHEWLKVSRADDFKSWGVTFDDINSLRTPTKDVEFIDENGNVGAHHNSRPGSWAHKEMDRMIDESDSLDEYWEKLQVWADDHVIGGREVLPIYKR